MVETILGEAIAKHRRTRLLRLIAGNCRRFLNGYENLNYSPRSNGERFVLKAMSANRLSCIFDVGANVGEWSLMAHDIFRQAKIHAFEVMDVTCGVLQKNTADIPNIIVNACGLSDKEETVNLRYYPDNPALTTMTAYNHEQAYRETTGVVVSGDTYVREHGIDHIELLKIDVEGAENLVLDGFRQTLGKGKIDVIQFEYGLVNILTKFLLRDFYLFFEERGYVVGKIYPNYVDFRDYHLRHEDFRGPNFLAVRRERDDLIALLS